MEALEKLNFNLQRENLQRFLLDPDIFNRIVERLLDQSIINPQYKDEIENQYKYKGKMETTNAILNILASQTLNTTNTIIDGLEVENKRISEYLEDIQYGWLKLTTDLKNEWKEKYSSIQLLPYGSVREIKTSDVVASFKLVKLINKDIFEPYLKSINLDYCNFYKIFHTNFNKILIQGESGIGKSVQLKYLVHTWANDYWKICSNKLILVIILRDVLPNDNIFDTILKQNFKNIPYMNRDLLISLLKEKNSDILLFIDGADEFNILKHPLNNIIENSSCQVSTVIWSRHKKAESIHSTCDIIFELNGFNDTQFKSFMQRYFIPIEKSAVFFTELEQLNDNIQSLLKVPLMGLVLYFVWQEEDTLLEKSLYEIYEKLIVLFQKDIGLSTESVLKRMSTVYHYCFIYLSTSKILAPVAKVEEEELIKCIGCLAQIIPQYHRSPRSVEIQFLHQSLQEYFAAKYLIDKFQTTKCLNFWKTSFDGQMSKINTTKLYNIVEHIRQSSNQFFQKLLTVSQRLQEMYEHSIELKTLLLNGMNNKEKLKIRDEKINNINLVLLTEKFGKYLVDLTLINPIIDFPFMMKLLISNANSLKDFSIRVTSSEKFVQFSKNVWHSILHLLLSTKLNSFTLKSLKNKNSMLKSCLEIEYCDPITGTAPGNKNLNDLMKNSSLDLRILNLNGCFLSESQSNDLAELILTCHCIHTLNISHIKLTNCGLKYICEGLKNTCHNLKSLNFYGFSLSEMESYALGEILMISSQIESIDLSWNDNMGVGLNHICEGLKQSSKTLKSLNFYWCDLNENQCEALRELLLSCSNIENLNLAWNKNINVGFQGILQGLECSSNNLTNLTFQNCNLTEKQLLSIGELLKNCSALKQLDLACNRNMCFGYKMIMNNLQLSSETLTNLNFYGCNLTELQSINLKDLLSNCSNIQSLNLAWNRNMGCGIQWIIESLKTSSAQIKNLNFCGCKLTEFQLIVLGEFLLICSKIEILDLSYNTTMNYGFKKVLHGLKSSVRNLKSFRLAGCYLMDCHINSLKELLLQCPNVNSVLNTISVYN